MLLRRSHAFDIGYLAVPWLLPQVEPTFHNRTTCHDTHTVVLEGLERPFQILWERQKDTQANRD